MKIWIRRIHLYIGLITGLIFTNTCITGTLLVFQEELEHAAHHEHYFVAPGATRLPVSALVDTLKSVRETVRVQNIRMYAATDRTVEIVYQEKGKEDKTKDDKPKENNKPKEGGRKGGGNRITAYINPYTGQVIATVEKKKTLFHTIEFLHRQLLANDTGKIIVGTSTLLFVFTIISGIILWWPAKRNHLKQKLTIKRNAGWKRITHDWHSALGFYACAFLFCSAITGIPMAFKWANNAMFAMAKSPVQPPEPPPSAQPFEKKKKGAAMELAFSAAAATYPGAISYQLNTAKNDTGSLTVQVLNPGAPNKNATDALYYDQYTGTPTGALPYAQRSTGARIRSYYVPLHTGELFGIPSKIAWLLAVLIGATLPTTGVIMWLNRTRKKKRIPVT